MNSPRYFVFIPMFDRPEDAIDWAERNGLSGDVALFRGPDGSVRGCVEVEGTREGEAE
jgi:hypothetical protein